MAFAVSMGILEEHLLSHNIDPERDSCNAEAWESSLKPVPPGERT